MCWILSRLSLLIYKVLNQKKLGLQIRTSWEKRWTTKLMYLDLPFLEEFGQTIGEWNLIE